MAAEKQQKKQRGAHLTKFQWKPGQSGNPNGRPPGKTLKEFAREYLEQLPEEEKLAYLATLPMEVVWKMAEGNPANNVDHTTKGEKLPTPIYGGNSTEQL